MAYQIPCKDCTKVYVGETGRRYGDREVEHIRDGKAVEGVNFTRSRKEDSKKLFHKSALTDHVAQTNHTIDCDGVTLPAKEPNKDFRGIKEAIAIRRAGANSLNRDAGRHDLPESYNDLLQTAAPSGGRKH